jgi:Reverse transcriptase (RNA-dependent DNA polymerase)
VTIAPRGSHLVQLRPEERPQLPGEPTIDSWTDCDQDLIVYPSESFQTSQPAIELLATIISLVNGLPNYQITAINHSDEPLTLREGIYAAKSNPIDMSRETCPLTDETRALMVQGALTGNHIYVANLDIFPDCIFREGGAEVISCSAADIVEAPEAEPTLSDQQLEQVALIRQKAENKMKSTGNFPLPPDIAAQLNLKHLDTQQQQEITALCAKYSRLWSNAEYNLGKISFLTHKIQLSKPLPPSDKQQIVAKAKAMAASAAVDKMIAAGLLEPSLSNFAQNFHIVAKKNTNQVRVCLDARRLNEATWGQKISATPTESLLMEMANKPFCSVMDVRQGYYHVPLHPDCKYLTAVFHPGTGQLYQFTVASMGLKNAAVSFIAAMNHLLQGTSGYCVNYVDDVAVYSETWADHLQHLETVFSGLEAGNIKMGLAKCSFGNASIDFLGFKLTGKKFEIIEVKQQGLIALQPPKDKKAVIKTLACFNYYRQFIENYASRIEIMQRLVRKDVPFEWTNECQ